jgi:hypothetical protein
MARRQELVDPSKSGLSVDTPDCRHASGFNCNRWQGSRQVKYRGFVDLLWYYSVIVLFIQALDWEKIAFAARCCR